MEEFNLLESLEDLVGQLQMSKMTDKQVLEILKSIVEFENGDKK
tara:strand:- start:333 stop:464 length:132 start_codon:yes stop_codon:yes gene_type:complete